MRGIALLFGGKRQESANRRHFAGGGRGSKAPAPAIGEEGAQIRCMEVEKAETADLLTAMATEKIDQPVRSRDIGAHSVRRAAAIMGEITSPTRGKGSRGVVVVF